MGVGIYYLLGKYELLGLSHDKSGSNGSSSGSGSGSGSNSSEGSEGHTATGTGGGTNGGVKSTLGRIKTKPQGAVPIPAQSPPASPTGSHAGAPFGGSPAGSRRSSIEIDTDGDYVTGINEGNNVTTGGGPATDAQTARESGELNMSSQTMNTSIQINDD